MLELLAASAGAGLIPADPRAATGHARVGHTLRSAPRRRLGRARPAGHLETQLDEHAVQLANRLRRGIAANLRLQLGQTLHKAFRHLVLAKRAHAESSAGR